MTSLRKWICSHTTKGKVKRQNSLKVRGINSVIKNCNSECWLYIKRVIYCSTCHESELFHCLDAGVEEPEAEARWELPEDHVLSGSPLPDLHTPEDAEHRPGHGGKSERPAPRSIQVSQRDAGPAGLPNIQIRHVLPKELRKWKLPFLLSLWNFFLRVYLGLCGTSMCKPSLLLSHRSNFQTWNFVRETCIYHQSLQTQAYHLLFSYPVFVYKESHSFERKNKCIYEKMSAFSRFKSLKTECDFLLASFWKYFSAAGLIAGKQSAPGCLGPRKSHISPDPFSCVTELQLLLTDHFKPLHQFLCDTSWAWTQSSTVKSLFE